MSIFGVIKEYEEKVVSEPIKPVKQKYYITICAEAKNTLTPNKHEWSFGAGSSDSKNAGYVNIVNGKLVGMGLSCEPSGIHNHLQFPQEFSVAIVKNGEEQAGYEASVDTLFVVSGVTNFFNKPLNLESGSVINFKTKIEEPRPAHLPPIEKIYVRSAVVSALIEINPS